MQSLVCSRITLPISISIKFYPHCSPTEQQKKTTHTKHFAVNLRRVFVSDTFQSYIALNIAWQNKKICMYVYDVKNLLETLKVHCTVYYTFTQIKNTFLFAV